MSQIRLNREQGREYRNAVSELRRTSDLIEKSQQSGAEQNEKLSKINADLDSINSTVKKSADFKRRLEKQSLRQDERIEALESHFYNQGLSKKMANKELTRHYKDFETVIKSGTLANASAKIPDFRTKYIREDIDPLGGFLAPPEFSDQLASRILEISPIRQNAMVRNTTRESVEVPIDKLGQNVFWVGEGETTTETDIDLGQVMVKINKQGAIFRATSEVLMDSIVDIAQVMTEDLSQKFAQQENEAFVKGDGVKKPTGVLSVAGIERVPSVASGTYDGDDIINLFSSLKTGYQGAFYVSRQQLGFIRKLKDLNNQYIWQAGLADGRPDTILGEPYFITPDLFDGLTPAANEEPIIYGDFRRGYVIYDRSGLSIREDGVTQLAVDMTRWGFYKRLGGNVLLEEAFKILKVSP